MRHVLSLAPLLIMLACAEKTQSSDTMSAMSGAQVGQTSGVAAGGDVQRGLAGLLDPNSATQEQLAAVPGMDSAKVAALIAGRPYADMLAVDRALQLNADQRKTVYAKLWKPIDLNAARGEEILLIPGVGARMRHEFEEYRPYTSMEQFRREIGKYVDKNELARLEQYVSVK